MNHSPLIDIQKSMEERIAHIAEEYGNLPEEDLTAAVLRLKKRLGGLRTQEALDAIIAKDHSSWISNLLIYYDKTYEFDLERHTEGTTIQLDLREKLLPEQLDLLLKTKDQLHGNS
jgi:tRNA 2-selenouridine synthase